MNVISGTFHQGSTIFEYPGVQCTFISLFALIYMYGKPPKAWTGNDIDSCVICGNERFIKHCFDKGMYPKMLLASELPQRLTLNNQTFTCFQSDNEIKVGTLGTGSASSDSVMTSLSDALEETFNRFNSCLFVCGGLTIALAKHDSTFYVFNPHSRDQNGYLHPEGTAVLVTCKNVFYVK